MPMVFGSHFWTPGLTPFSTRRGTRRGHPGTRRGHPGTRGGHPGTPSWDAYGPSWDPWGSSWDAYRAILGRVWASLGRVWASLGRVWACLGRVWACLGRVWACLGRVWADRARKRAPRVRRHVTSPPDKRFRARARKSRKSVSRAATFERLLPRRVYCMLFFFFKIKLKRERQRDTTRLRLTWESLDSQPASLRLNSLKFCGRGKRAGLCSAAAVLPRNSSPTEALDPSFHARALISSPKP